MEGKRTSKRIQNVVEIKKEPENKTSKQTSTISVDNNREGERSKKLTASTAEMEATLEKIQRETEEEESDTDEEESSDDSGSDASCIWDSTATDTNPLTFRPARTPGIAVDATASWTPLSVFQLFCSSSAVSEIVENTNKNAARQKEAGVRKTWTEITVQDFYAYLSALVYSSLVKRPKHTDYWERGWVRDVQFPSNVISVDQFEAIHGALFLCDPEENDENERKKGTPKYDELFKIKPFYTELANACRSHFQPRRNIWVLERKAKENTQFKCDYRMFVLTDSVTGYTWNLYIDTGKSASTRGQTAGYRAVKNLLPVSVIGSGYTLYTDGLLSSPRLFTELLEENIGCCGVLSENHPAFFKAPEGLILWRREDKLLFVQCTDSPEVTLCSTVHEEIEVESWEPERFSHRDAVADFSTHSMLRSWSGKSDVDLGYCIPGTVTEWHSTMFYHLLDLAVDNSFILYKEGDSGRSAVTEERFRAELCREMFKFATNSKVNDVAAIHKCAPMFYEDGQRKDCRMCSDSGRMKAKTDVFCRTCRVPLCLNPQRNCYIEWHSALYCFF